MSASQTLKPRHNELASVGSGSAFTSLTNFEDASTKAYTALVSVGSGSTFTSISLSTYQVVESSDFINMNGAQTLSRASQSASVSVTVAGSIAASNRKASQSASASVIEESDIAQTLSPASQVVLVNDGSTVFTTIAQSLSPSSQALATSLEYDETAYASTLVAIDRVIEETSSCMIAALPYDAPPVTDVDHPSNPFLPTIAIDGAYITSNPSTQPSGGVAGSQIYINIANPGLGDTDFCGLYNYTVNFNLGGGTFSFLSQDQIGSIGQTIPIFGYPGTITETGKHTSSSGKGWQTSGIFGSRAMNKQILLTMHQTGVAGMAPTVLLQSPTSQEWTTVKSACKAIAARAGVPLGWAIHDAPLTDMFAQSGQRVIDAIQSLVSKVGAVLCYLGNGGYVVIDPVAGYGSTSILPDCHLLAPGGIQSINILDLDSSILIFPTDGGTQDNDALRGGIASFDMAERTKTQVSSTLFPSATSVVNTIKSFTTKPKVPVLVDIPGDAKDIKARIRVSNGTLVGGIVVLDTTDPEPTWANSPFSVRSLHDGKRQIVVSDASIPSNLTDGEFVLDLGYTTYDYLSQKFDEEQEKVKQRKQLLLAAQQEYIRYIRVGQSVINMVFYGQVPMPGLRTAVSYDGVFVEGLIESVSISSPGYMTVQIGKYIESNFLSARAQLDFYGATGTARPPGVG